MKIKSFPVMAMSGLLLSSLTLISPVMADDAVTNSQTVPSDNSVQNQNNNVPNAAAGPQASDLNNANPGQASDQATPDTATGDDDY